MRHEQLPPADAVVGLVSALVVEEVGFLDMEDMEKVCIVEEVLV